MGGKASQAVGVLLVGGASGAWLGRMSQADGWVLVLVALLGAAFIGGGWYLERSQDRAALNSEMRKRILLMDAIAAGWKIWREVLEWSGAQPSMEGDPTALKAEMEAWSESTEQALGEDFHLEVAAFIGAVHVPTPGVYVDPRLRFVWEGVHGRIAWLQNRLSHPMPTSPAGRRSPRCTKHGPSLQPPSQESGGTD